MNFAGLPTFATKEEERRKGLEDLAGSLRIFGKMGFTGKHSVLAFLSYCHPVRKKPSTLFATTEGISDHCTLRDPIFTDHFWVNPLGLDFGSVCVSDLLLISPGGDIIMGSKPDRQQ